MGVSKDPKSRREALKQLLEVGLAPSQEEICAELVKQGFDVTQSTISRDLRFLGSIRIINAKGETNYQFPEKLAEYNVSASAF
ncbi:MAG: hypothetical protein H7Z71_06885 [Moraxellaceae bacterium]|nr:hypothetical protein [Pseudobdellovibrionaceae bacterium]